MKTRLNNLPNLLEKYPNDPYIGDKLITAGKEYRKCFKRENRKWQNLLVENRENDLILIMTPGKQDKTSEFSKHWSADSTPARNEVIMKPTYAVNE